MYFQTRLDTGRSHYRMMDSIRLVCFDLNGTLIKENSWMNLNFAMGVTPKEDLDLLNQYREGNISYQEGLKTLLELYKKRGKFSKKDVLNALFSYTYCESAKEIISYLHKKHYHIAILSGSFDVLVEKVAGELHIPLWAANNRFVFDENGVGQKIECISNDDIFKREKVVEMCSTLHIKLSKCACIGDSENDREIFQLTKRGIALRGSPVVKVAWKVIEKLSDIRTIF
jgi:phosphoserine phosphatase